MTGWKQDQTTGHLKSTLLAVTSAQNNPEWKSETTKSENEIPHL